MPKLHSLKWEVILTLLRMVGPEPSFCSHTDSTQICVYENILKDLRNSNAPLELLAG